MAVSGNSTQNKRIAREAVFPENVLLEIELAKQLEQTHSTHNAAVV